MYVDTGVEEEDQVSEEEDEGKVEERGSKEKLCQDEKFF